MCALTGVFEFDVLLIVHLSIILVINQLNAQNPVLWYVYYMPLHVSSTMCSSSGGQILLYNIWYRHTCRWPFRAQVERGWPPTGVMIPDAV